MSVLTLGPKGLRVVGDASTGKVLAIDLKDRGPNTNKEGPSFINIETRPASLLGASAQGVPIHELAVNPTISLTYACSDLTQ